MRARRTGWAFLLPGLLLAACATATGEVPATGVSPAGEGPWQRFIVRYRDGTPPAADETKVQARLDRAASESGLAPALELRWQRRLSVKADLFVAGRPLDRAEATRLMQVLDADPEVDYVEVDQVMGIGPVRPGPLQQP